MLTFLLLWSAGASSVKMRPNYSVTQNCDGLLGLLFTWNMQKFVQIAQMIPPALVRLLTNALFQKTMKYYQSMQGS